MSSKKKRKIPPPPIDDWIERQTSRHDHIKELSDETVSECHSYNPETTLFISIVSHGVLLLDEDGNPSLTECQLRNVEKKNVSNIGICSKRFMASPIFAYPEKIDKLLESDLLTERQRTQLFSIKDDALFYDEVLKILDEILFTPNTPRELSELIISDYESNRCNFTKTFPTIHSIERSYSMYLTLKQKIMESDAPIPVLGDLYEKFSCRIQQNKPNCWISVYNLENERNIHDNIIFSIMLRGDRKFYNIFFKDELERLFRDIKEHQSSTKPIEDIQRDIQIVIQIDIDRIKSRLNEKLVNDTYYENIDTIDIFSISKLLQDYYNIEKILITDFSCKSTENVEKDAEYKYILERETNLGYGGTKKRKSNKICY
jgi:hypothetical protein